MKLKLNNVRLSFPQLFEAQTVNGEGKPAFSANFLINPKDPQLKAIDAAIDETATEKWAAKAPAMLKQMRATDKVCLHDGDLKTSYAGYEGMRYISSRNPMRPLVIDSDKTPVSESDGRVYSGCYVNVQLELWAQDNQFGKRVNATLLGVQFFRDGEAFSGGGVASQDDFDDVSAGTTADDLV